VGFVEIAPEARIVHASASGAAVIGVCIQDLAKECDSVSVDDRQLRYFMDVATFRSINKASEHCNIAQPALSRRMRQLEYDLDVQLFIRSPQGIELTNAGKQLLVRSASLIRELDRLGEIKNEANVNPGRHLRLGMPPGVSLMLLPRVVREIYRHIDGIILQIDEEDTQILIDRLLERRIDIAVISYREVHAGLEQIPYFAEPLFFACHIDQPHSAAQVKLPFAMPLADEKFYQTARKALESLSRAPDIDLQLASIASIKRLVDSEQACTLAPYSALIDELNSRKWYLERVKEPALRRIIVWRKGEGMDDMILRTRAVLLGIIQKCAEEQVEDCLELPMRKKSSLSTNGI
jgi:LysR family nitrogen assimilation transcriptional regulator